MEYLIFDQLSSRLAGSSKESMETMNLLADLAINSGAGGFILGEHFDGQFWGMDALQTLVPLALKKRPEEFVLGTGSILRQFHDGAEALRRALAITNAFGGSWEFGIGNGIGGVAENQKFEVPKCRQLTQKSGIWNADEFGFVNNTASLVFRKDAFMPSTSEENWCYPGFIRPPSREALQMANEHSGTTSLALRCLWQDSETVLIQELESFIGKDRFSQIDGKLVESLVEDRHQSSISEWFDQFGIIVAPPADMEKFIQIEYGGGFDRIFICPAATNIDRYISCAKTLLKETK